MNKMPLSRAFTLIEPGPVVLLTTFDGQRNNIMTLTWTMVMDFSPTFAITTGPWNYSYQALTQTRECVLAIPAVDMIDHVIGIGMCSGTDTDKFERFGLTAVPGERVRAPLIQECLANIECRVEDIIDAHGIVVLNGVNAYLDHSRQERRLLHAVGDGTFRVDGPTLDRRAAMRGKIPDGV